MGEHDARSWIRAGRAVAVSVAAVVALASCSLLQVAPNPTATTSPSATDTVSSSVPVPSATPVTTSTPSAGPTTSPVAQPSVSTPAGKQSVSPFITAAVWDRGSGQLDVAAFVPQLVEPGGTCTATVASGGRTVTVTVTAAPGASDMQCNPIEVPAARLTNGEWTVTVTYTSTRSFGVSAARTVTVTE